MSDVILYAALKENLRLNNDLLTLCAGGSTNTLASYEEGATMTGSPYAGGATAGACSPAMVTNWEATLKPFVKQEQAA